MNSINKSKYGSDLKPDLRPDIKAEFRPEIKAGRKTANKAGRKTGRRYAAALAAMLLSLMLAFTSCAGSTSAENTDSGMSAVSTEQTEAPSKAEMFTDRDLSGDYDESEAVSITLDGTKAAVSGSADGVNIDGSSVTITKEGTYILTGTLSDGQIAVDADDQAKVQIVLKDASVTSKTSAAIYVISADKVFVTTAEGTNNMLANGGSFASASETSENTDTTENTESKGSAVTTESTGSGSDSSNGSNIDGAVFAKDDITFNGKGTLTITSPAGHGIVGKDDVKIGGGTVTIEAANHGIQANDSVRIAEASVTITAGADSGKDGIHVNDGAAEDGGTSESFFYMSDGELTVGAGDDAVHAESYILIEGGTIEAGKSYEGLEALTVTIAGGDIDVTATDDGINAAGGSSDSSNAFGEGDWGGPDRGGLSDGGSDGSIVISGGKIHIKANGDAIDSNGSLEISGGYTVTEGPSQGDTSVLDYNGTGTITGGTFIGTGGAGMASNFSSAENQGVIAVSTGDQSAGTTVTLKDSDGKTIAEVTPSLDYAVVYISTPDMKQGGKYTLSAGTYSETIELTDLVYGNIGGRGAGGPGHGGMDENGDSQSGQNGFGGGGSRPDGMNGENGSKEMRGGMKGGKGRRGGNAQSGSGSSASADGSSDSDSGSVSA